MRYCERMRARYFPETLSTLAAASEEAGRSDRHEPPMSSRVMTG